MISVPQLGIPFLDQFSSYSSILAYFEAKGKFPFQNTGRSALEAAILYRAVGDSAKSAAAFELARADKGHNPRFAGYVRTIETKIARVNGQSGHGRHEDTRCHPRCH